MKTEKKKKNSQLPTGQLKGSYFYYITGLWVTQGFATVTELCSNSNHLITASPQQLLSLGI